MKRINRGTVVVLILLLLLITSVYANFSNLSNSDGVVTNLSFDREAEIENITLGNGTYNVSGGSNSYFLDRFNTPRISLEVCHENLSSDHYLDVGYFTYDYADVASLLNLPKKITDIYSKVVTYNKTGVGMVNETINCSLMEMDLTPRKAVYPGSIVPIIYIPTNGTTYDLTNMTGPNYLLPELDGLFNGSFKVNVRIIPPQNGFTSYPKRYSIFSQYAFDEKGEEIDFDIDYLMTSVIASNKSVMASERLDMFESLVFPGYFKGGEEVLVNDLTSLEIKVYVPCTPLNASGYYILNDSVTGANESCVVIENTTNVVLNFVGEEIQGNNNTVNESDPSTFVNSSLAPGSCAVKISNSVNISIEAIKSNMFHTGLCIENSSVNVFGDGSTYNVLGANISGNSSVGFYNVTFINEDSEIIATGDSVVIAHETTLATAMIKSTFSNVIVRSVYLPPPPPENLSNKTFDLGQFVQFTNTSSNAWADIAFYYNESLPNNVSVDNVSIWKYNGTYDGEILIDSYYDNISNSTVNIYNGSWVDGDWIGLLTYVSPIESLILAADRIYTFSVFAPYSDVRNITTIPEPEPEPEPNPKPDPTGGGGSGGGAGRTPATPDEADDTPQGNPIELELDLPDFVVIHQGELFRVPFNLTNIGNTTAQDIVVGPSPPSSWDFGNRSIDRLDPGNMTSDDFLLAPYEKALAKTYYLPVRVYDKTGISVLSEILEVHVIPKSNLTRIRVLEYPQVLQIAPSSKIDVSFLVENMGEFDLENVRVEIKDNDCLEDVTGKNDIEPYETGTIKYGFYAKEEVDNCKVNAMFYNQKGDLVGFAPLEIQVTKDVIPAEKVFILILVLIGWTVLTAWLLMRRFNSKV